MPVAPAECAYIAIKNGAYQISWRWACTRRRTSHSSAGPDAGLASGSQCRRTFAMTHMTRLRSGNGWPATQRIICGWVQRLRCSRCRRRTWRSFCFAILAHCRLPKLPRDCSLLHRTRTLTREHLPVCVWSHMEPNRVLPRVTTHSLCRVCQWPATHAMGHLKRWRFPPRTFPSLTVYWSPPIPDQSQQQASTAAVSH